MGLPSLRRRLADGFALSAWSSLTDPLVHEALLKSGFDAILFDMQHGLHDVSSIAAGIAAAAAQSRPALVRVPVEDRATVSRALDLGACGVVMPMIETAADAAAFVSVAKYPPHGLRSFGPTRTVDLHGFASATDYTAVANTETLAFAMIETRASLDNLDAIAAVDGLDGFFIGPSDLSIALSGTGARDPDSAECKAAVETIRDCATTAGKFAGIYAGTEGEARRYRDLGFPLVCVASDIGILKTASTALVRSLKA